jgi:serine protease Do
LKIIFEVMPMKKILIFLSLVLLVFGLAGCSFFNTTTSTVATNPITTTPTTATGTTTTSQTTTGTLSVNMDEVIAALYERIYADLYADVRVEVIADLTQERFQQIYDQVITELLTLVDSGELTLSAEVVADQILEVAVQYSLSVVGVSNLNASDVVQSLGSGIVYKHVGDTYWVVTNQHVVEDGASFQIRLADETTYEATLLGVDSLVDLAVLRFTTTDVLPVADFGDSDTVSKGDLIIAVGHPSGYEFFQSTTLGIVSGIDRYFDIDNDDIRDMFVDYIQHDASINSGNSGGALFNLAGEVIGINVIKIAAVDIEGMGFAIPINLAAAICADIEVYGVSKQKPVLGITFRDIATTDPYEFTSDGITIPVGITAGFYIQAVGAGSTMDGYLQAGDILLEIGDVVIEDTTQFVTEFSKYRVGDIVDIVYYRDGQTYTVTNIELKPKVVS